MRRRLGFRDTVRVGVRLDKGKEHLVVGVEVYGWDLGLGLGLVLGVG